MNKLEDIGVLLNKWALMGIIENNITLAQFTDNKNIINKKMAVIEKGLIKGYIIYNKYKPLIDKDPFYILLHNEVMSTLNIDDAVIELNADIESLDRYF